MDVNHTGDAHHNFNKNIASSIPYSLNRRIIECNWRYGIERKSMIARTQHSVTSASSLSPAIVISSIDIWSSHCPSTFPTSMIQPTLNSSDYHFQQFHIASTGRFSQHCIENRHRSSELQVQQPMIFPASHSAQSLLQHKRSTDDEQLIILIVFQGHVEIEQPPAALHTMDPSFGIRSLFVFVVRSPSLVFRTC